MLGEKFKALSHDLTVISGPFSHLVLRLKYTRENVKNQTNKFTHFLGYSFLFTSFQATTIWPKGKKWVFTLKTFSTPLTVYSKKCSISCTRMSLLGEYHASRVDRLKQQSTLETKRGLETGFSCNLDQQNCSEAEYSFLWLITKTL